ncbi:MAG: hypothetical protein CM15mP129_07010 [Chloroflexota bacterium]|nr:MAG: hypothetical protein CM15mP129_07010 [Chloroflexota bacterium]
MPTESKLAPLFIRAFDAPSSTTIVPLLSDNPVINHLFFASFFCLFGINLVPISSELIILKIVLSNSTFEIEH